MRALQSSFRVSRPTATVFSTNRCAGYRAATVLHCNASNGRFLAPSRRNDCRRRFPLRAAGQPSAAGADEAEERWQEMFQELKEHKATHGHTNVVLGNPLGRWVYKQRDLAKEGKVPDHRRELLEGEGFEWEHPFETQGSDWNLMYSQLLEFHEAEGHCAVKKKYPKNPALGYWVNEQRIAKREGRLTKEQEDRLNNVGFEWEARKQCGSKFMIGFRELVDYRDAHGTIEVPADDPKYSQLRTWITAQRGARRKGILSEKRVDYLEGIGFKWDE